jgi:NAD dependent epimerase/dehydratase
VSWQSRPVLVTGAGGFIGSHLTELLVERGARVRALVEYNPLDSWGWLDESPVRDDVEVVLGDVRDADSMRSAVAGADVVFHLAALIAIPYSYEAPLSYVQTNIVGTTNVLRAALDAGAGLVVHTSTSEVYGSATYVPIDEAHPLQGQSPYAASKIGADKMAEAFGRSFGLSVATLRPFNTYGPRQSARAVIPTIASQILAGDVVRLGNLDPTRDFTFVKDTARAFVQIAEAPAAVGRTINVGSGSEIAIGALAELVAEVVGRELRIESDPARLRPEASEVDRLCADTSLARELLGWSPQHGLRDGLAETVEWVAANLGRYRAGLYTR